MLKFDSPKLKKKKILISSELAGQESSYQDLLKKEMKRYGKEIKDILKTKGDKARICEVCSGGGAQGFFSIGRSLVMSFFLEKYGIHNVRNMSGNSVGGAQVSLMSYYQAMHNMTYREAGYKVIGKMYNMGKLKISKWNVFLSLFKIMPLKLVTPKNPMEQLARAEKDLKTVTYGDLHKKGFSCFTVFSELVGSTSGFAGFNLTLQEGIKSTTRFFPPATVTELPIFNPQTKYVVDGGISTNLPTYSAYQAYNNNKTLHNPKGEKLDFMTVSFLGNIDYQIDEPVKNLIDYFKRLLDYVSIKATSKGIRQSVETNTKYKYGDYEYVPLIPFGAFKDCTAEGVMTFEKKIFRERFKTGVDFAIETLQEMSLITAKEAQEIHDNIYNNIDNSPELADMDISGT